MLFFLGGKERGGGGGVGLGVRFEMPNKGWAWVGEMLG